METKLRPSGPDHDYKPPRVFTVVQDNDGNVLDVIDRASEEPILFNLARIKISAPPTSRPTVPNDSASPPPTAAADAMSWVGSGLQPLEMELVAHDVNPMLDGLHLYNQDGQPIVAINDLIDGSLSSSGRGMSPEDIHDLINTAYLDQFICPSCRINSIIQPNGRVFRCAACQSIAYCSVECQRYDWTFGEHKQTCQKWKKRHLYKKSCTTQDFALTQCSHTPRCTSGTCPRMQPANVIMVFEDADTAAAAATDATATTPTERGGGVTVELLDDDDDDDPKKLKEGVFVRVPPFRPPPQLLPPPEESPPPKTEEPPREMVSEPEPEQEDLMMVNTELRDQERIGPRLNRRYGGTRMPPLSRHAQQKVLVRPRAGRGPVSPIRHRAPFRRSYWNTYYTRYGSKPWFVPSLASWFLRWGLLSAHHAPVFVPFGSTYPRLPCFDVTLSPELVDNMLLGLRSQYHNLIASSGVTIVPDYATGCFQWARI